MASSDLAVRLDEIHQRLINGSRVASRDLFLVALQPLIGFVAKSQPTLRNDEAHDIATDALLAYLNDPRRCDLSRASLWTVSVWSPPQTPSIPFDPRETHALLQECADDVAEWSCGDESFENVEAEDAKDFEVHGHRLATSEAERRLLMLSANGRRQPLLRPSGLTLGTRDRLRGEGPHALETQEVTDDSDSGQAGLTTLQDGRSIAAAPWPAWSQRGDVRFSSP
jgi:hypothetical protein